MSHLMVPAIIRVQLEILWAPSWRSWSLGSDEDYRTEKVGLPGGQSDGSGVAHAHVCSSDLNVLPLWGLALNADADGP